MGISKEEELVCMEWAKSLRIKEPTIFVYDDVFCIININT